MSQLLLELLVLFILLIINGVFAMAEIAVVSSRKARLQAMIEEGSSGAKAALVLAEQPGTFLSTVQVGITLVSTLAGAYSGVSLISELTPLLAKIPHLSPWAGTLSMFLVVGAITLLSVIIGELVPKRMALSSPEKTASRLSKPMMLLAKLTSPLVRLLDTSSSVLTRMLGMKGRQEHTVSEEEVRALIRQGTVSGVFNQSEQRMVEGVMELDDLVAADVMTPKNQIIWLDLDDPDEVNWQKVASSGHSYLPAHRGVRDNVLGLISVKALCASQARKGGESLEKLVGPAVFVPETMSCLKVIEEFRKQGRHLALVIDEFGGVSGLITLNDIMEAVVGALPEHGQRKRPNARQQADGSLIADAMMDMEELANQLDISLPAEESKEGVYRTLGGFVLQRLGHVPEEGEKFSFGVYDFEVIDMDRHRIDKVVIRPKAPDEALQSKA